MSDIGFKAPRFGFALEGAAVVPASGAEVGGVGQG